MSTETLNCYRSISVCDFGTFVEFRGNGFMIVTNTDGEHVMSVHFNSAQLIAISTFLCEVADGIHDGIGATKNEVA